MAVLDPDVVLRADSGALPARPSRVIRGAASVAEQAVVFARPDRAVGPALVNGAAGLVARTASGRPVAVMGFTVAGGRIVEIDVLADPARVSHVVLHETEDR